MSSIKLSPEHGLNPSMITCFWCGKDKGVALMGRIDRDDKQAPAKIFHDYEPCDDCKELFSHGIHIIGVSDTPTFPNQPSIKSYNGTNLYPTGTFTLAKPEFIIRILESEDAARQVLEAKTMLMESSALEQFLKSYNEKFKEEFTDENCESGIQENHGAVSD